MRVSEHNGIRRLLVSTVVVQRLLLVSPLRIYSIVLRTMTCMTYVGETGPRPDHDRRKYYTVRI